MDDEIKDNVSTIATWVYVIIAPYIAQHITQDQFATLVVAVVGLCIAVYSSANPNKLKCLGNDSSCDCENEEVILNEEYTLDPLDDEDGVA